MTKDIVKLFNAETEHAHDGVSKLAGIEPIKKKDIKKIDIPPISTLVFHIDPIQLYLNALKMQKLPIFAEAMNRNMTGIFFNYLDYKVEKKENIGLEVKGATRCVSSDTQIKIVVGSDIVDRKIATVKNRFDAVSWNFDKEKIEIKSAVKIDTGRCETLMLRTKSGREVTATTNHKLFVMREGKIYEEVASNIKIGDKLVTIE